MRLQQFTGPFGKGSRINLSNISANYVHIGIQIPYAQPIAWQKDDGEYTGEAKNPDIQINNHQYIVNKSGILEFDGELKDGQLSLVFLKAFPSNAIIDVIYKNINE